MKNNTKITLILTIILIILLAGCSIQTAPTKTVKVNTPSPEESLVRQTSDGRIVEIYEKYVKLSPGSEKENWIIIRNAKEKTDTFKIIPCEGCTFDTDSITLEPSQYKVLKFSVKAAAGQKEIKVKDGLNNAYGYAQLNVVVE